MILRYLHRPHRARPVAARAHPVPQLIEVVPLRLTESADADGIHARRSAVGLDLPPRLVHEALVDLKRLHLLTSIQPSAPTLAGWPQVDLARPAPLLQPHYRAFTATTSRSAPVPRIGTLPLVVSATWGTPSRDRTRRTEPVSSDPRYRGDRFSCSMPAPATSSRHLYTGHRQGSTQPAPWLRTHPRAGLCPGDTHNPRFRCHRSTFRCVCSGSSLFVFSSHT